jgi:hypothetical protein
MLNTEEGDLMWVHVCSATLIYILGTVRKGSKVSKVNSIL